MQKGVHLLDLATGKLENIAHISDERLVWQSMFWTPDGSKLLLSAVNGPQRWLEWQFWDESGQHIINQFLPTREQIFFLHFFEQFVHSHPIMSSDSTHFYFSGYEAPSQRIDILHDHGFLKENLSRVEILKPLSMDYSQLSVQLNRQHFRDSV